MDDFKIRLEDSLERQEAYWLSPGEMHLVLGIIHELEQLSLRARFLKDLVNSSGLLKEEEDDV